MGLLEIYQQPGLMAAGLILISIWSLIWKGIAMWYAAGNKQKGWYIAILVLNTLGLLPIIYLLWFKNRKKKEESTEIRVEGIEEVKVEKPKKVIKAKKKTAKKKPKKKK
jgi:methionyl-tRNA synthetase